MDSVELPPGVFFQMRFNVSRQFYSLDPLALQRHAHVTLDFRQLRYFHPAPLPKTHARTRLSALPQT